MSRFLAFFVLMVPIVFNQAASAQAAVFGQAGSSAVYGSVLDPSGAVIVDVDVSLKDQIGGTVRTATTNQSGEFRFSGLLPSTYEIEVRRKNFKPLSQVVQVGAEAGQRLSLVLEIAAAFTINERVMVVGDPLALGRIPGSAHFISAAKLEEKKVGFDDVHSVLREVPGVNIQEEDGYGLRPNIGLRGSGTDRSSTITLMEDGVLVAPAPYAASAAYYFPTAGRMEAIEIRKGSSQIKYGPRTNGGALNLMSTSIPDSLRLGADITMGGDSTRKVHATLGDAYENFGWLAETYQFGTAGFKRLDGGGDTGYDLEDYMLKFRFNTGSNTRHYQQLEVKLGYTDQKSDETYLGLSDSDFLQTPFRRYAASQKDVFNSTHKQYQARHFLMISGQVDLTTTVYRNDFARNWYKLNDVNGRSISDILESPETHAAEFEILRGADTAGGALRVRANNRSYYAQGVESVLGVRAGQGAVQNQFEFGFRYHKDQEDRFQHDDRYRMLGGQMVLTQRGAAGSSDNRVGDARAWAFFAQDEIRSGPWTLTPGMRFENIEVIRTNYATSDPARSQPTGLIRNNLSVWIPGVGVMFDVTPSLALFSGVHKGFAPPGPGSNEETDAESSINYEFGARARQGTLRAEVVGFFNGYRNLLGRDTLSTGGSDTGMQFNGGKVRIRGIETSLQYDFREVLNDDLSVPVQFSYTLTQGEFRSGFSSGFEPWGTVSIGDELPYLPRHQVYSSVGVGRSNWGLNLGGSYTGQMRISAGSGAMARLDSTDAYLVLNGGAEYGVGESTKLFVSVQNLANNRYVVARHPAGARPGLPRTLSAGIRIGLGF